MRFASAWRSQKKDVGAVAQPLVAGAQRHHLGLGDHRHGVEVEVVERLARQQLGLGQMPLDAPPVTFGQLVLGNHRQQPGGRPTLLVRLLGEGSPDLLGGRQAQLGQQQRQAGSVEGLVHAATSIADSTKTS